MDTQTNPRDFAQYAGHAQAAARRLSREVRPERDAVRVPYELALSAARPAAYVPGPALGGNPARVDAHLDALTRHIVEHPAE
ncbi:hypothetical protein OG948_33535 [Embleya sp. NBC_00888]|uniref:hypothetical protein n=1 Tax=Embleya sp. NBC_00888 TaxID=2975960 RepID=UPI00386D1097|nr:hypothetical protein OG948_33535 [Embleya sp. NBC_00888]